MSLYPSLICLTCEKASNLAPDKIKQLGLGSMTYAGLFLIEGIGLWIWKRWAEWSTVIITSPLIPIEIYEIYRHPIKIAVLLVNVANRRIPSPKDSWEEDEMKASRQFWS
jgi:uncharacterized membrane protein (DUF2068 family)